MKSAERIKDILSPERKGKKDVQQKNNLSMLNGMLWIERTGADSTHAIPSKVNTKDLWECDY